MSEEDVETVPAAGAPKTPNALTLTVMGDSIAFGTGDETGKGGFSAYLPEYLKNQMSKDMTVENLGIND